MRYGLTVDGRDRAQLLGLVGRQANRHGFDGSHMLIVLSEKVAVNIQATVVAWYQTSTEARYGSRPPNP